ncbi:unnamed protein product [marine sediment metagenome]|uniref:Uncharacterized protein n=1 Tax=marine sediment metagenome TaxID=412755 RepID=X0TXM6_9ZZZZ
MLTYYYPRTLKGISVAILNMFNDMKVVKYDKDGNSIVERKIPITWGPVEKYNLDRKEDHYVDADGVQHNFKYYPQLPRMALVLNGIVHSPDRATGVNQWRNWFKESLELSGTNVETETIITDYQPAPYDYNFTLYIKTDSTDYLAQILENILPYFNPSLQLRVKEFSFLNIERDLQVTMDGVNPEFVDDMGESDTKFVNASINLTVKGWAYRKFLYSKIIKHINTKYWIYDTGVFLEGFSLTGVQTTGATELTSGVPIEMSAVPPSGTYYVSGSYLNGNKQFDWFQTYNDTSGFGFL